MAYTTVPSAKNQILDKIARDAAYVGLTVSSRSIQSNGANAVVISNGSNALTVSYSLTTNSDGSADVAAPMGGIDNSASPFLGIGMGVPGAITITSAISTNSNITDVIDSKAAAQVLQLVSGFANDIVLSNANASFTALLRGTPGLPNMGQ